jgi:hypothetical protein
VIQALECGPPFGIHTIITIQSRWTAMRLVVGILYPLCLA